MKDLIVAVADGAQEKVLEALLPRIPLSSGTRSFTFEIVKNPENDSGSYNISQDLLRPFIQDYSYALVIFDYEGSGAEHSRSRDEVSEFVENKLNINGWNGRNAVIVIEPELENWLWLDSPHFERAIGWQDSESVYAWARRHGEIETAKHKPNRPKECMEKVLQITETPRSSSIYKQIAERVSYLRCQDPSFLKLIDTLQNWFPP